MSYLEKAKHSNYAAELCINSDQIGYDDAISRRYYAIFKKMLFLLKVNSKNYFWPYGKDSHKEAVKEFIALLKEKKQIKSEDDESDFMNAFNGVKKARKVADYEEHVSTEDDYRAIEIQIQDINHEFRLMYRG